MTIGEQAHRDFYLAMRRARGNVALRACNRKPVRAWRAAPERAAPEQPALQGAELQH